MNKITMAAITGLIALTLASPLGAADHDGCNGVVTTIPVGPETIYIDDRSEGAVTINHWIYLEDNGRDGLQTGGTAQPELPGFVNTDPCDHDDPDTILF